MTAQLDMFGGPSAAPAPRRAAAKRATIGERFEAFHVANPHVFDAMLKLALARLARGERRIAVKALWEELRAALARAETAYDGYKPYRLDNSYTALYARRLIELEPALADVIETRQRKAK